jgi:hypothetical protein
MKRRENRNKFTLFVDKGGHFFGSLMIKVTTLFYPGAFHFYLIHQHFIV